MELEGHEANNAILEKNALGKQRHLIDESVISSGVHKLVMTVEILLRQRRNSQGISVSAKHRHVPNKSLKSPSPSPTGHTGGVLSNQPSYTNTRRVSLPPLYSRFLAGIYPH